MEASDEALENARLDAPALPWISLPFGEPHSVTGSVTNNLRFPGQYYDEETGQHYNY